MTQSIQHPRGREPKSLVGLAMAIVIGVALGAMAPAITHAAVPGVMAAAFADDADFAPMTNTQMSEARGGVDGIAFGIFLTGTLNAPSTTTLPPGVTVNQPGNGQIQIVGGIGNLAGASGIFQLTNIVGDMNVVNNNIIINVSLQAGGPTNVPGNP